MKKIIHKIKVYPKVEKLYEPFYQKRRVAIYARVSTSSDEQLNSIEAQRDYYLKYVEERSDLIFVKLYADEGISGTSTKYRTGFNQMIEDALDGKIDLIVTKSISRFARNTVDSLVTIRKLKENGIECFFEKENIYTFDGKGELLITIMSSIAQEESRSISENVTWGQRKRFADGKVTLPYKNFLGYKRGDDGRPEVVEEEAKIVRLIYRLYLEGWSASKIAKHLTGKGIPTPAKKKVWQSSTVESILTNEKYKGDALLQKKYTVDFLTKKQKNNEGEIPQYYVEGSHEKIVSPEVFDLVQYEYERRKQFGKQYSTNNVFSTRIFCGQCGGMYGSKVWHSNTQYRTVMYRCNNKYGEKNRTGKECTTPALRETEIKEAFLGAFNSCITNRSEIIKSCRLAIDTVIDITKLTTDVERLTEECAIVAEMIRKCVDENAHISVDPQVYADKYESLANRYTVVKEQLDATTEEISKGNIRKGQIEDFLNTIKKNDRLLTEFDETIWCTVIEKVTVFGEGNIVFQLKGGTEVKWSVK